MGSIREWLRHICCKSHDRAWDINNSTPKDVRDASHDLSNATMTAQSSMGRVREKADALTALVSKMQHGDRK